MTPSNFRRYDQPLRNDYTERIETRSAGLFYVFYNGEVTEGNYLRELTRVLGRRSKLRLIRLNFAHGSPVQVVEQAVVIRDSKIRDDDTTWAVFDCDDFAVMGNYTPAIEKAMQESISVAYSNECFELWLLLHFQDVSEPLRRTDLRERLTKIREDHSDKSVSLNDKRFPFGLLLVHGNQAEAIRRAEILHAAACSKNEKLPWLVNPVTTMHELVQNLTSFLSVT